MSKKRFILPKNCVLVAEYIPYDYIFRWFFTKDKDGDKCIAHETYHVSFISVRCVTKGYWRTVEEATSPCGRSGKLLARIMSRFNNRKVIEKDIQQNISKYYRDIKDIKKNGSFPILVKYLNCVKYTPEIAKESIALLDKHGIVKVNNHIKYHRVILDIPEAVSITVNEGERERAYTHEDEIREFGEQFSINIGKELIAIRRNMDSWKNRIDIKIVKIINTQIENICKKFNNPIGDFLVRHYYDFCKEYLNPKIAKRCPHCRLFFINTSKNKKYCSWKSDDRDCGKKAAAKRDYEKHGRSRAREK